MSRIVALPLRERKKQEELLERTIEFQLSSRSKKLKVEKREKNQKKKSVGELLSLLNYCGIQAKTLRPAYDYVPKSNNLDKQLVGLISHMFVKYPVPDWEFEAKNLIWTVVELRNNRELINEGRKRKHCVYSYVHWCKVGRSAIFSLRGTRKIVSGYTDEGQPIWDKSLEQTRITLEVNPQSAIVQVRGVLNRLATDEERGVVRLWAGEKGIRIMG